MDFGRKCLRVPFKTCKATWVYRGTSDQKRGLFEKGNCLLQNNTPTFLDGVVFKKFTILKHPQNHKQKITGCYLILRSGHCFWHLVHYDIQE